MHACVDGWLAGWLAGWMDGWVDGWMDGWMNVCNPCLNIHSQNPCRLTQIHLYTNIYSYSHTREQTHAHIHRAMYLFFCICVHVSPSSLLPPPLSLSPRSQPTPSVHRLSSSDSLDEQPWAALLRTDSQVINGGSHAGNRLACQEGQQRKTTPE